MYMGQLNIHLNQRFEKAILRLMKLRGLKTKSETVRAAVEEALERAEKRSRRGENYKEWLGLGLRAPLNPSPRFHSDDDLWR